jgi:HPt (histidine-containing phosphotransfer) domain-containing protein
MPNSEIDLATFEELKQMSGEDFIKELLDTFLDDAPKLIEQLKSAVAAKDVDSFRRAAHSLKSNAATFGAQRLSDLAKQLEMLAKENNLAETGDGLKALEQAYRAAAAELKGLGA